MKKIDFSRIIFCFLVAWLGFVAQGYGQENTSLEVFIG